MHAPVHPEAHVPLAPLCTLEVGGPAQHFATAETADDVLEAVRWARNQRTPLRILGGGSNVVISDAGVEGLVLRMALRGIQYSQQGSDIVFSVGAGEPWDAFVATAIEHDCQGIECLSGIPGLVGATPIQNVGAYGQEVAESIVSVQVLDRRTMAIEELTAEQCSFGYRDSLFKSRHPGRYVVLAVRFRLRRGAPPKLAYGELGRYFELAGQTTNEPLPALSRVRDAVLELRRRKSMVIDHEDPNRKSCGSFFVNAVVDSTDIERISAIAGEPPPAFPQPDGRLKIPSAWLIERSGLGRGTRHGNVGLSSRHTLAIVAHPGATAAEVIGFADHVRATVQARFGIRLVPEPEFWGFDAMDDRLPRLATPCASSV